MALPSRTGVTLLALVGLHVLAACLAPALIRRFGRNAYIVLAVVPAMAMAWIVVMSVTQVSATQSVIETLRWIPGLGIDLTLRLDPLSATIGLLVTGIGALVLLYCARYFPSDADGNGRLAGTLTAFAGAMLGLVLADNTLVLYVFWELTTILSYLLVGHSAHRKASRRAAMQALIITIGGGLAMLAGLIILGEQHSYLLSELVSANVATSGTSGMLTGIAVVLVLAGALSKSAIFPLHFWLPAAMAAPTPVSAYLHAAAMVKAGVYLVARLAPGFTDVPIWRPIVITLGLLTMVLGAWRALQQTDLKLLLAFGTVSQLGFLLVLLGAGTREAALAGVAMLVAHATFKATLFLVVGAVDHSTGTRDLNQLSGVGRQLPLLRFIGVAGAASMAGLPPMAGFVAKETAFEAFVHPALPSQTLSWAVLAVLVTASALTAAYSARFVWGAFATKPDIAPTPVTPPSPLIVIPPALLALATLGAGLAAPLIDRPLALYADGLPAASGSGYHLALWHGLSVPLGLSAISISLGALLFVRRAWILDFIRDHPGLGDADQTYRQFMRGVDRLSRTTTSVTQSGSLPVYLAVILAVLLILPAVALATASPWPLTFKLWDSPPQLLVALLICAGGIAVTMVFQRLAAVLLVGLTGYGIGVLFILHGAPDLALTQFLIESMTVVTFVLVLRKLPKRIVDRHTRNQRRARLLLAVPLGILMASLGAAAIGARSAPAVSVDFAEGASTIGGGKNVVNVTLVDIRAWDTLGEIAVLVVAATGVASLVFLRRRTGTTPGVDSQAAITSPQRRDDEAQAGRWLRGGNLMGPGQRSVVLEVVVRFIFHTVVILSLYLLFAGHNAPGGGFAGGLVAGLALIVRYLAGGRYELGEAAPIDAGTLLGAGLLIACTSGVIGVMAGGDILQSIILEGTLPIFGDVKLVTSLFFDIGVYLIVVGLVLDILRSLGAELDRRVNA
jgi:multicomponent Na+:H+ antiporter subunit A